MKSNEMSWLPPQGRSASHVPKRWPIGTARKTRRKLSGSLWVTTAAPTVLVTREKHCGAVLARASEGLDRPTVLVTREKHCGSRRMRLWRKRDGDGETTKRKRADRDCGHSSAVLGKRYLLLWPCAI